MKFRKAIYPGSFDPITMGHLDIIQRVHHLFDELVVLISHAPDKKTLFTTGERKQMVLETVNGLSNVTVDIHEGLTIDAVRSRGASVIIRGLRAISDFEYEFAMANMNRKLAPEIETMMIFARPEYTFLASRMVKEVAYHDGDIRGLVTPQVEVLLKNRLSQSSK